jgi:hypothetical protein
MTSARTASSAVRSSKAVNCSVLTSYERSESQSAAVMMSMNPMLCDDWLARAMKESCLVSSIHTSNKAAGITVEQLARNWKIPLERDKRTLSVTTQRGIKVRPTTMMQRFKTNDRMLRYNRLNTNMFTDTMASGTLSRRHSVCEHVGIEAIIPQHPVVRLKSLHHRGWPNFDTPLCCDRQRPLGSKLENICHQFNTFIP